MINKFKENWKEKSQGINIPKIFEMIRHNDESGTSGTGKVLDGVIFPSGKVVICWNTEDSKAKVSGENVGSITMFDNFEEFHAVHIGQHPTNGTEIHFLN